MGDILDNIKLATEGHPYSIDESEQIVIEMDRGNKRMPEKWRGYAGGKKIKVGDLTVNDNGIWKVIKICGQDDFISSMILSKDAFVQAYDKWIRGNGREHDHGLYVKIFANDEPEEKAEKLYRICGIRQELIEVIDSLKEFCDPDGWDDEEIEV